MPKRSANRRTGTAIVKEATKAIAKVSRLGPIVNRYRSFLPYDMDPSFSRGLFDQFHKFLKFFESIIRPCYLQGSLAHAFPYFHWL